MSTPAQPIQQNAAPDPNQPPVVPNGPVPGPDLSALSQPGASIVQGQTAPNYSTAVRGSYEQAVENQATAVQKATDLANAPTPAPYVGPHAKLFSIIQAIGTGLSAAGASIGSHGREGRAEYIENINAQPQQQKLQAQQGAQATKNQQIQNQLTIGSTNEKLANSYQMLMALPNDLTKSDLTTQKLGQEVTAGQTEADSNAQTLWDTRGFVPQGYEADPSTGQVRRTGQSQTPGAAPTTNVPAPAGTPNVISGVTPTTAAPAGAPSTATANALVPRDGQYFLRQQSIFDASAKAITAANNGKTTPLLDAAQKVMDDPKSTVYQIQRAEVLVQNAAGLSDATVKRLKDISDSQKSQVAVAPPTPAQLNTFIKTTLPSFSHIPSAECQGYAQEASQARTVDELNTVQNKALASEQALVVHEDSLNATAALAGNKFGEAGLAANEKLINDPHTGFLPTLRQAKQTHDSIVAGANGNALLTNLLPTMEVLGINHAAGISRISPAEAQAAGVSPDWATRWNAWATKASTGKLSPELAKEGQALMDIVTDSAYAQYVQSARVTAQGHNLSPNQVPAVDRNGNITTLDKAGSLTKSTPAVPAGPDPFAKFGGKRHPQ
jgi:hypothetical protein